MRQDPEALNLEQALGVLRRRWPWILLCMVVVASAAFGFSKNQTKKYTATASLAFNTNSLSQQIAGLPASSGSTLLAEQTSDLELVKVGNMAADTAALLGDGLTEQKVASSLSIGGQAESNVVSVSATATSSALAAAIANTYAAQFVKQQQSANRRYFTSARAVVNKELAKLSPQQRVGADGLQLQERAQTLSLLAELNYNDVQVAQEAQVPTSPSSPKTSRNTGLGLLLGLVIGLGLAFALERLDRRIRRPKDLATTYGLPMLGVVPRSAALSQARRRKRDKHVVLPLADAEAFSLIRAHLDFFDADHDLRTVMIASAAQGDGKTTVARYLSEAAARLGSRVLLLDVDLRCSSLAANLDIDPGPGLADVLVGAIQISEGTRSVKLAATPGDGTTDITLDVLTAGAVLPTNPGELIASRAMDDVLEWTKSAGYDLVIIDTPPLAAVSDAFPLLRKVDGVAIVGWVGRSRRDAAEQLRNVLASSGASLIGVIANGVTSGGPTPYPVQRKSSPASGSGNGAGASQHIPAAKA